MRQHLHDLWRAAGRHTRDVVVIAVTAAAGIAVIAVILSNQVAFQTPTWVPGGADDRFTFEAEFGDASGIVPGMGQPVAVAGVQVGAVGEIKTEDGVAVIEVELEGGDDQPQIYRNATMLLRPRTALKDMFVALEPGTSAAGELPANGRLPVSQTQPSVDIEEILANLDADTRDYLRLLLAAGSEAFRDPGSEPGEGEPSSSSVADLSGALRRLDPLAEETRLVTEQLGQRRENLQRAVHGLTQVTVELASISDDVASLVQGAERTFAATGSQDAQLADALSELPGTLAVGNRALKNTEEFGRQLRTATSALHPFARSLAPAEQALQPFAFDTLPVISDQLRPFSRDARPVIARLKPVLTQLSDASPGLKRTLDVFGRFFNAIAYNPPGSQEGYLFWGSWLAHIAPSLLSIQDAHGAAVRSLPMATCAQLDALYQVELGNPSLSPIIKLINLPDRLALCH